MSTPDLTPMRADHWAKVAAVYAEGIATGHANFEATPPTWESFDADHLPAHRFVAVDEDGPVLGWAAASPVSGRCTYAGVIEDSVYVAADARGLGVGRTLLNALLTSAQQAGAWTIQAGIFPENTASLALHHAAGFRSVGTRERYGRMTHGPLAGHWRDVLLLENRQPTD